MKENNKHIQEDKNYTLPNEAGFSAPKGYFDTVEDHFSAKLIEEHLPKNSGFKTPESYFENLEDLIISKIQLPKKGKVISLRRKTIKLIPVAAAIALFLFVGINFIFTDKTELSSDEIALWFDNNINAITNDDLITEFGDLELDDTSLLNEIINDSSIESYVNANDNYLLIQDIDININELK
tara:strand:- start:3372 stop:3917 length:546 start_codon:yes stop_codon:yes gene_type:complete